MTRRLSKYEQRYRARTGKGSSSPSIARAELVPAQVALATAVDAASVKTHTPEDLDRAAGLQVEPVVSPVAEVAAVVPPAPEIPAPTVVVGPAIEPWTVPAVLVATFDSSNVRTASLDTMTNVLTVTFANGTTYRYGNFTPELLAAWQAAKSPGSWFHANVKTKAAAHPVLREVAGGGDHVG